MFWIFMLGDYRFVFYRKQDTSMEGYEEINDEDEDNDNNKSKNTKRKKGKYRCFEWKRPRRFV